MFRRRRQGINAAAEWIKSEFESYSKACGGCLEVKTDEFTQEPGDRVPQPTKLTNVYAVLRGSDAANAGADRPGDRPLRFAQLRDQRCDARRRAPTTMAAAPP